MRKYVFIGGLAIILGSIIGGIVVSLYFDLSFEDTREIQKIHYRADWERRAFQAYTQESP